MYLEKKPFAQAQLTEFWAQRVQGGRTNANNFRVATSNFVYIIYLLNWCHLIFSFCFDLFFSFFRCKMIIACYWPIQCLIANLHVSSFFLHSYITYILIHVSRPVVHLFIFGKYCLHLFWDLQCGDTNYWLNILSHLSSELINSLIRDITFIHIFTHI